MLPINHNRIEKPIPFRLKCYEQIEPQYTIFSCENLVKFTFIALVVDVSCRIIYTYPVEALTGLGASASVMLGIFAYKAWIIKK